MEAIAKKGNFSATLHHNASTCDPMEQVLVIRNEKTKKYYAIKTDINRLDVVRVSTLINVLHEFDLTDVYEQKNTEVTALKEQLIRVQHSMAELQYENLKLKDNIPDEINKYTKEAIKYARQMETTTVEETNESKGSSEARSSLLCNESMVQCEKPRDEHKQGGSDPFDSFLYHN